MRARFDVVFGGDYRENLGFACVWGGGDRSRITKVEVWGEKEVAVVGGVVRGERDLISGGDRL